MADPVTLSTSTIAALAFQTAIQSSAGELAKQFTAGTIAKIDQLRQNIIDRLKGRSERIDAALVNIQQGDHTALSTIAKNLDVVMDEQPDFAAELHTLAQAIQSGRLVDHGSMNQTNFDGTNFQTTADNSEVYQAHTINITKT